MSEQPEQWAVDWRKVAELAQDYEDPRLNKAVSALHGSIQRAFAEREAELVAENFRLAAGACINPGQHGLVGDAHGNGVCTAFEALNASERENAELVAENAKLREALEWFLTGDIDVSGQALIYEGHWEDIAAQISKARKALTTYQEQCDAE